MAKEIAVFVGADGASTSLEDPGKVKIFRRTMGFWELNREKEFYPGEAKNIRDLRAKITEILAFMDGCRVFVAKAASGVPYFELEKAGCSIWECTGKPEEFLERVWDEEEKEATAPASEALAIPVPEERSPGNYYISISAIQQSAPEITSKQVLRPFIQQRRFKTLEVACRHVPPWIEMESIGAGLNVSVEQIARDEFRIRIVN